MASPIHHMTVIRYYRDERPWDAQMILAPAWEEVEDAIRRMDNYCFPIVQLNPSEHEDDGRIFNVCGGVGRWALFQMTGDWQFSAPGGGDGEVRLWESDQGYYCREKNVLTDLEKVLRITQAFYDTSAYDTLDAIQ